MKEITVCVGSSCYLKGSYDIVTELQHLIKERQLQHQYELKAEFCQGNCSQAPCLRVGETLYEKVSAEDVQQIMASIAP